VGAFEPGTSKEISLKNLDDPGKRCKVERARRGRGQNESGTGGITSKEGV